MLGRAGRLAAALRGSPAERAKTVRELIEQVIIDEKRIIIKVWRAVLLGGDVLSGASEQPSVSTIEVAAAPAPKFVRAMSSAVLRATTAPTLAGDRGFASRSVQRRVNCKPDSLELTPACRAICRCSASGFARRQALADWIGNFQQITRSRTGQLQIRTRSELEHLGNTLLEPLFPVSKGVRLLGISLSSLGVEEAEREPEFRFGEKRSGEGSRRRQEAVPIR